MDLIRATREISHYLLIIGISMILGGGLSLILMYLFPAALSNPTQTIIFMIYVIFIGIVATLMGGVFAVSYWLEERKELNAILRHESEQDVERLDQELQVLPTIALLDSIDRQILDSIRVASGDILAVKNQVASRALIEQGDPLHRRIATLKKLGVIGISKKTKRIFLTPSGQEALDIPAVLFVARIPHEVRKHMTNARVSLGQEKWASVVFEAQKSLEVAYKRVARLEEERNSTIAEKIRAKEKKLHKSIDDWTAGQLHNLMVEFGVLVPKSFETWLSDRIIRFRRASHDSEESRMYTSDDAMDCDMYLNILMKRLYRGYS